MLDASAGSLTARQIVMLAERKANNPGLHLTTNGVEPGTTDYTTNPILDAPAYAYLQILLDQLALTQTFTFTRTALDFNITGRHNDLPPSYWRVGFADPCWLVSDGAENDRTKFFLLDAEQFHNRFQDGIAGRPQWGYINRATGVITVDPEPDAAYILELHFYPWQPALAAITERPWFPHSQYLVNALLCDLYLTTDDQRWQIANSERSTLMKQIKGSMGDSTDRASKILQLDPAMYPTPVEL